MVNKICYLGFEVSQTMGETDVHLSPVFAQNIPKIYPDSSSPLTVCVFPKRKTRKEAWPSG